MSANLRSIQGRIENIEDIRQITRAMNAIAMTKVTRMKRRLSHTRSYLSEAEAFLARLLGRTAGRVAPHALTVANACPQVGVLVLNSDRGLCGRFKGDLNRKAEDLLRDLRREGRILAGGEKARAYFARRPGQILASYARLYEEPDLAVAGRIARDLVSFYQAQTLGRVILVYMRFTSDLVQRVVAEDLLPVRVEAAADDLDDLIEPDPETALAFAVPFYVQVRLLAALTETKTSEHAIRRQAMRSATDNADDLLVTLTRAFHKARQQSITREIADIVGGAEALREME